MDDKLKEMFANIQVVQGDPQAQESNQPSRTVEEDWAINFASMERANAAGNWVEVFNQLTYLSNIDSHPAAYLAMAQRAWMALKLDIPAADVALTLYNLLVSLGPTHGASGAIASLANFLAQRRSPGHEDRELAVVQAQQMLRFVAQANHVEGGEPFQQWVLDNQLDNPDYFIPVVMDVIEGLARGRWWINREAIQHELDRYNAEREAAPEA